MGRDEQRRAVRRWALVGLYLAAIFVLSAQPSAAIPGSFHGLDKWLHGMAYGLLAAVWCRALAAWPLQGRPTSAIAAVAVLLAALYGISDEVHQAFVPMRTADLWDWIADGIGAGLGAAAWTVLRN